MKLMILVAAMAVTTFTTNYAKAEGSDVLFDNLIASPDFVAHEACLAFQISAGENLQVFAQEDSFNIQDADQNVILNISVPSQGNYVFKGQPGNRTANEIDSLRLGVKATMNPVTTDITLERLNSSKSPCLLTRCAAFGGCN